MRHRVRIQAAAGLIGCGLALSGVHAAAGQASTSERAGSAATTDDRARIVWSQFVGRNPSTARIVIGDPQGRHVRALSHPGDGVVDIDPELSPDGRWVAFERDTDNEQIGHVAVAKTNRRHERVLDLGCVAPCAMDLSPAWTPNGRHLWFTRVTGPFDDPENLPTAALWRTDLSGDHVRRVSQPGIDGEFEDYYASFAPAGYVVFNRLKTLDNGDAGNSAVFRMNRDGSRLCRLTPWSLDADLPEVSPATSGPTRDRVVFETYGQGAPPGKSQAVATVGTECGLHGQGAIDYLTSPTSQPVEHFNPSWSPHGRRIAYVKFADLDSEFRGDIWSMRRDGTGKRPVSQSPRFEYRPDWGRLPVEGTRARNVSAK